MGDSSGDNTAFVRGVTADQELMDTDVYGEYSCKGKCNRRFLRSYMRTDKKKISQLH